MLETKLPSLFSSSADEEENKDGNFVSSTSYAAENSLFDEIIVVKMEEQSEDEESLPNKGRPEYILRGFLWELIFAVEKQIEKSHFAGIGFRGIFSMNFFHFPFFLLNRQLHFAFRG